jgi:hypothetical protein
VLNFLPKIPDAQRFLQELLIQCHMSNSEISFQWIYGSVFHEKYTKAIGNIGEIGDVHQSVGISSREGVILKGNQLENE